MDQLDSDTCVPVGSYTACEHTSPGLAVWQEDEGVQSTLKKSMEHRGNAA